MNKKNRTVLVAVLTILLVASVNAVSVQAAQKLKMSTNKITTYIGGTPKLKVTGASGRIVWKSSNKKIAKVSSAGKVTALKNGKTVISAKNKNKTVKCVVYVKKQLSAKKAVAKFKNDMEKQNYVNLNIYMTEISDKCLYAKIGANMKKNILCVDLSQLGFGKTYRTAHRVYSRDSITNKWFYYKNTSTTAKTIFEKFKQINETDVKLLGNTKFNGKKVSAVQAKIGDKITTLYFSLTDYTFVGLETVDGNDKVIAIADFKTKINVPGNIINNAEYRKI